MKTNETKMRLKFRVNLAAALRRGVPVSGGDTSISVDPAALDQADRDLLADSLAADGETLRQPAADGGFFVGPLVSDTPDLAGALAALRAGAAAQEKFLQDRLAAAAQTARDYLAQPVEESGLYEHLSRFGTPATPQSPPADLAAAVAAKAEEWDALAAAANARRDAETAASAAREAAERSEWLDRFADDRTRRLAAAGLLPDHAYRAARQAWEEARAEAEYPGFSAGLAPRYVPCWVLQESQPTEAVLDALDSARAIRPDAKIGVCDEESHWCVWFDADGVALAKLVEPIEEDEEAEG